MSCFTLPCIAPPPALHATCGMCLQPQTSTLRARALQVQHGKTRVARIRGRQRSASYETHAALVRPTEHFTILCALTLAGTAGDVFEKRTQIGKALSAPLSATVIGLIGTNTGLLPVTAPAYEIVQRVLLPIAVSCLLFSANLKRVFQQAGVTMLAAFAIASIGTLLGTLGATTLVPLQALGDQSWRITSALLARHIGGAQNHIAVCNALNADPTLLSASLAASNCTCILYFTLVFWLGGRPKESPQKEQGRSKEKQSSASYKEVFNALALASSVCAISYNVAVHLFQRPGLVLVISTAITVCIASIVPTQLERLTTGGEIIATISLQMFFATVGTGADIQALCSTAPAIFLWSVIQVTIHLAVVLGVWCLTGRFHKSELLTASNAAVGGPTTALALTASKGWDALRLPGILVGILGSSIATFVGVALGPLLLKPLSGLVS